MTAAADLLAGDFIQARMRGDTAVGALEQWLVTEFTVTGVTGTVVAGNVLYPAGLDEAAGWTFELIARPTVALPLILCEIVATLTNGTTPTLMGKGTVWTDTVTGSPVTVDSIVSFTPTV
jgi:hypothetical protein